MKIQVLNGVAHINIEAPIFIGATSTIYYRGGVDLSGFAFKPLQGESGILVFDHENPTQRNPLSPTYFRYWWNNEKLEMRAGLHSHMFLHKEYELHPAAGLVCRLRGPTRNYCSWVGLNQKYKRVPILDLLKFLEGKITREELKALVIPRSISALV
jgi:hypothetical protein